jgi:hypothetical protein
MRDFSGHSNSPVQLSPRPSFSSKGSGLSCADVTPFTPSTRNDDALRSPTARCHAGGLLNIYDAESASGQFGFSVSSR